MPIYEYRCRGCQRVFAKLVPMNNGNQQPCPHCGSQETNRLISLVAARGASNAMPMSGHCCGGGCGHKH